MHKSFVECLYFSIIDFVVYSHSRHTWRLFDHFRLSIKIALQQSDFSLTFVWEYSWTLSITTMKHLFVHINISVLTTTFTFRDKKTLNVSTPGSPPRKLITSSDWHVIIPIPWARITCTIDLRLSVTSRFYNISFVLIFLCTTRLPSDIFLHL